MSDPAPSSKPFSSTNLRALLRGLSRMPSGPKPKVKGAFGAQPYQKGRGHKRAPR